MKESLTAKKLLLNTLVDEGRFAKYFFNLIDVRNGLLIDLGHSFMIDSERLKFILMYTKLSYGFLYGLNVFFVKSRKSLRNPQFLD